MHIHPAPNFTAMWSLVRRLIVEEEGQDLIEYALLSGAIGFAGAFAFDALGDAINSTYTSWDGSVNDLWVMPEPGE